jgi:hypothetical protein
MATKSLRLCNNISNLYRTTIRKTGDDVAVTPEDPTKNDHAGAL